MTITPTDRIEVSCTPDRPAAAGVAPLGLDAEGRLVEARAAAFVRELGAPGELGRLLARRAAVLSVRMDQSAARDLLTGAALADSARVAFDADRRADRAGWVAALRCRDRDEVATALEQLRLSPEGLDDLVAAWSGLHAAIGSADEATAAAARDRATLWLAAIGEESTPARVAERVAAEVAALRDHAGRTRAGLAGVVAQARHDAGVAATFDPAPEAKLARRHEAAAERGFFRALHLIRALRRDAGGTAVESARAAARAPIPAITDRPAPVASIRTAIPPVPLGSFRPEAFVDLPIALGRSATPADPARKARPDLRKVAGKRR